MKVQLLSIVNVQSRSQRRPGIYFYSDTLYEMGFVPGALVQAVPGTDGSVRFNLCDENIRRYSELDAATREKGGRLIQMNHAAPEDGTERKRKKIPLLSVRGSIFSEAGLEIGDIVIARYEHGTIFIKKPSCPVRFIKMSSVGDSLTGERIPKLQMTGEWLTGFGFVPDSLLTAEITDGSIIFKLMDDGIEKYSGVVRHARENGLKLLQVKTHAARGKDYPFIKVLGNWLTQAGFDMGEQIPAFCGPGLIKLQKPDSVSLGF